MKTKLDRDKLKKIIKEKRTSMREVSLKAGLNESFVKDLMSNKIASPSIDNFIKIVDVLGIYPNDIIPLEWRRHGEINETILAEAIEDAIDLLDEEERTPARLAHIINVRYQRREKRK